jgi:hypothetical protein
MATIQFLERNNLRTVWKKVLLFGNNLRFGGKKLQNTERDLYVLDFDEFLAHCIDPKAEANTHFMTLDYVRKNPDWYLYIDDYAFLNRQVDLLILTARHPDLAEQISEMFYGWQVIGRNFDLDIKKILKRTHPVNREKYMKRVVKFKIKYLKGFAKIYRCVFFLDDDWKLYKNKKIRKNVSVFQIP